MRAKGLREAELAKLLENTYRQVNIAMVYLLGVAWVATRFRAGPAIFASILAVAAFDFLFIPPFLRFAVADAHRPAPLGSRRCWRQANWEAARAPLSIGKAPVG
mgnify:CR=1 FL=1